MKPLLVLTTCGAEDGERIAKALVERQLAACVNAVPGIRSTYRWEGKVVTDDEHLLVIKTTTARYPELEAAIHELSSYDVPEVVAVPIERGSEAYLGWLAASVERKG